MPRIKKPKFKGKNKATYPKKKRASKPSKIALFETYKEAYKKRELALRKKGQVPEQAMIEDFDIFSITFDSVKITNREKGARLQDTRLATDIARMQMYKIRRPQAIAEKKFFEEEYGEKIKLSDILQGKYESKLKEMLKKKYREEKERLNPKSKEEYEDFYHEWDLFTNTIFGSK